MNTYIGLTAMLTFVFTWIGYLVWPDVRTMIVRLRRPTTPTHTRHCLGAHEGSVWFEEWRLDMHRAELRAMNDAGGFRRVAV